MRKTYISSDFKKTPINGVNTIEEKSNFFSTILLDIPDLLEIDDDVIWYDNYNGEQIDLDSEVNLTPNYYSVSESKLNNHVLSINQSQTKSQLEYNTLWNLRIDNKIILVDYIFSKIKQSRTFEGLLNIKLDSINIDSYIEEYIIANILPKYELNRIELYINHLDIRNNIRYNNIWNSSIDKKNIYNRYSINSNNSNNIEISFTQNDSSMYIFEYYFSLSYNRI
jgi:hypothetical protein